MKKLWLILAVLVFVSVNASAQLTSGLMNYEVKHGLLPKADNTVTTAADKKTAQFQDQLEKAIEKAKLKAEMKSAYQEIGQDAQNYLKEVMQKHPNSEVALPFIRAHQRLLEVAAMDMESQYVYQSLLSPLESLYLSWSEVAKKNVVLAEELRKIAVGHCYWLEGTQEHLTLEEIVEKIHESATFYDAVTIKGEAEGFYKF